MIDVKIYQMKGHLPGKFLGTGHFLCALKDGKLNREDYDEVYTCQRPPGITPEDLFYEFNGIHPQDFRGHSLSVSNVVEIDGKLYFCDTAGFKSFEWM